MFERKYRKMIAIAMVLLLAAMSALFAGDGISIDAGPTFQFIFYDNAKLNRDFETKNATGFSVDSAYTHYFGSGIGIGAGISYSVVPYKDFHTFRTLGVKAGLSWMFAPFSSVPGLSFSLSASGGIDFAFKDDGSSAHYPSVSMEAECSWLLTGNISADLRFGASDSFQETGHVLGLKASLGVTLILNPGSGRTAPRQMVDEEKQEAAAPAEIPRWYSDRNGHWHETAGGITDIGSHIDGHGVIWNSGTCIVCGYEFDSGMPETDDIHAQETEEAEI